MAKCVNNMEGKYCSHLNAGQWTMRNSKGLKQGPKKAAERKSKPVPYPAGSGDMSE